MNKWYGVIGFAESKEVKPGIYRDVITEKPFYGTFVRKSFRNSFTEASTVSEIQVNNQISVIADAYAISNFSKIVYVTYMGTKVRVTGVELEHPRMVLNLGGTYDGEQA